MTEAPFPYRLVASDLDGTLLGPDKAISAANLAAVRSLRERGARFVLASGRRHQNSVRFHRQLGLDGLLISCAGALVKDPQTGETVRDVPIPADLADQLVERGQDGGFTVIYYHRDHLYAETRNPWTELYESRVGERAELFPGGLRSLRGEAALKIVWYSEPSALGEQRPRLEETLRGKINVVSTDSENLEFLAADANKAAALEAVAAYYGVDRASTLALGDGENDAAMLQWAGTGIAMDNGSETAKAAANLVVATGNPEESFARAVRMVMTGN